MSTYALYYFSATGNSLAAALSLAQRLGDAEVISIPGSLVLEDPYAAARQAKQVGLIFPVHRATMPEMVRGFIEQMPAREDCYYFAISTYSLFGCNEFWDIDEILTEKGAMLNYAAGVKMTGNIGLGKMSQKTVRRKLANVETQIADVADALINRQGNYFQKSIKIVGSMVRTYTNARRKSIVFTINDRCTRCGICAQVCPAQNIIVSEDGVIAPVRSDKCEACMACIHWCPSSAVNTATKLHGRYHHPDIEPRQLNPRRANGVKVTSGSKEKNAAKVSTAPKDKSSDTNNEENTVVH